MDIPTLFKNKQVQIVKNKQGYLVACLKRTFLFNPPRADLARKLQELKKDNEQFIQDDKIIFLYYPEGYGRAVMNNNAFEKALQVEATTRNWKTVNKLYEIVYDR